MMTSSWLLGTEIFETQLLVVTRYSVHVVDLGIKLSDDFPFSHESVHLPLV